jgi:hypothetical protein
VFVCQIQVLMGKTMVVQVQPMNPTVFYILQDPMGSVVKNTGALDESIGQFAFIFFTCFLF